jgi:hypothetical protein
MIVYTDAYALEIGDSVRCGDGSFVEIIDIDGFDTQSRGYCGYGIRLTLQNGESIDIEDENDSIEFEAK